MKIVLLGATGQVGRELCGTLAALGDVVACDRRAANLERPEEVVALLARERPAVIVNAAAHTAVDRAEREPDRAELVNATAVAAIAAEAARQDAILVHYSTDYVFDGTAPDCYRETDDPRPLSVYGATKLAGERAIAAAGCRHYVFRTSWVYAPHGSNFLRTILRLASERDELAVVADQTGAPTSAALVAEVTARFLGSLASAPPAHGLYHLAPRGRRDVARLCTGDPGSGPRSRPAAPRPPRSGTAAHNGRLSDRGPPPRQFTPLHRQTRIGSRRPACELAR